MDYIKVYRHSREGGNPYGGQCPPYKCWCQHKDSMHSQAEPGNESCCLTSVMEVVNG